MDGLSVTSGAIAVVSLAIQIGNGIKKLCDFWDSVQDSPKDVRTIIKQLNIISHIIDEIREEAGSLQPYSRALSSTHAALDSCAESIQTLEEMIAESQPGLACRKRPRRTWAAIKFAWNGDKLKKCQGVLGEMKSTLILATQHSNNQSQQQTLATITQGVATLLQQRSPESITNATTDSQGIMDHLTALREEYQKVASGITNPVARFGFENLMDKALSQLSSGLDISLSTDDTGAEVLPIIFESATRAARQFPAATNRLTRIHTSTTSNLLGRVDVFAMVTQRKEKVDAPDDRAKGLGQEQFQTTITFHPSQWLLRVGVSYGIQVLLSKSMQGFDYRLKSYRAVPDDALVFQKSEMGDNEALQKLFSNHQASAWDTNSRGLTPLFFAARAGKLQTCKLLLSQGADLEARARNNDTVASYACLRSSQNGRPLTCREHIDVLRMLVDDLDFLDDVNCSGLLGLRRLLLTAKCSSPSCSHQQEYPAVFVWAIQLLREYMDMKVPSIARMVAQFFRHAMKADDIELMEVLMPIIVDINRKELVRWFSAAHELGVNMFFHGIRTSDRFLIKHCLDVRAVTDEYCIRGSPTPMSLAMQYSYSFFLLRKLLRVEGVDLTTFILNELAKGALKEAGWTREILSFLFEVDFCPLRMPMITCSQCSNRGVATERSWLATLLKLKALPIRNAEAIFKERDRDLMRIKDLESTICQYCQYPESESYEAELKKLRCVFLFGL
ncbi:hypothetical protein DL98DRAFT_63478 [Cadophora sp. DSE1049]|nr:hypothetical protein DL98DRAFT_63478 [Cadophora sp. DSE1049]